MNLKKMINDTISLELVVTSLTNGFIRMKKNELSLKRSKI